jgi:hypothetical protein
MNLTITATSSGLINQAIFQATGMQFEEYAIKSRELKYFFPRMIYAVKCRELGYTYTTIKNDLKLKSWQTVQHMIELHPDEVLRNTEYRMMFNATSYHMEKIGIDAHKRPNLNFQPFTERLYERIY